jgi:hypothetical protein
MKYQLAVDYSPSNIFLVLGGFQLTLSVLLLHLSRWVCKCVCWWRLYSDGERNSCPQSLQVKASRPKEKFPKQINVLLAFVIVSILCPFCSSVFVLLNGRLDQAESLMQLFDDLNRRCSIDTIIHLLVISKELVESAIFRLSFYQDVDRSFFIKPKMDIM